MSATRRTHLAGCAPPNNPLFSNHRRRPPRSEATTPRLKESPITESHPFILQINASAEGRILVFAEDMDAAETILHERRDELITALQTTAGLPADDAPTTKFVTYDAVISPAMGFEVAGSASLIPGLFTVSACTCRVHGIEEDDEDDE